MARPRRVYTSPGKSKFVQDERTVTPSGTAAKTVDQVGGTQQPAAGVSRTDIGTAQSYTRPTVQRPTPAQQVPTPATPVTPSTPATPAVSDAVPSRPQVKPDPASAARAEAFQGLNSQQLFSQIRAGNISPSRNNPVWTALYQNGQPSPQQLEAFQKWENFRALNPEFEPKVSEAPAPVAPREIKPLDGSQEFKSISEAEKALEDMQAASEGMADGDGIPTRGLGNLPDVLSDREFQQKIIDSVTPSIERPTFDAEKSLRTLRQEFGVEKLQSQIDDLTAQENEILSLRDERIAGERGRRVALDVIGGRVSEIEAQENVRLNAISNRKRALLDAKKSADSVVSQLQTAQQTDYKNAAAQYEAEFNDAVQAINLLKGFSAQEATQENFESDNARASLQTFYNFVQNGSIDPATLSSTERRHWSEMEVKAGFSPGTFAKILTTDKAGWKIHSTKVAADGSLYAVIQNPQTGEQGIRRLGSGFRSTGTSGATPEEKQQKEIEKLAAEAAKMANQYIEKVNAEDITEYEAASGLARDANITIDAAADLLGFDFTPVPPTQ